MKDEEIIPFLRSLSHPTFFTQDWDYFKRELCHAKYCLVHVDVGRDEIAGFIRRSLRHEEFNTRAERAGTVVRDSYAGLAVWHLHADHELRVGWAS